MKFNFKNQIISEYQAVATLRCLREVSLVCGDLEKTTGTDVPTSNSVSEGHSTLINGQEHD